MTRVRYGVPDKPQGSPGEPHGAPDIHWRDTCNRSWRSAYSIDIPSQYFNSVRILASDSWGDDFRLKGNKLQTGGWFRYFAGFIKD